jgi:hypothetical protein
MGRLKEYFDSEDHRIIDKWIHYFDIYERHLSPFKGKDVTMLEIGVSHGGSLQMWKDYFGSASEIYGVDINPECKKFEEPGIRIFIGSQSDRSFLKELVRELPRPDIIIDDGGHMMKQQIISFQELYDHLKEGGVYICEDLHTSYWLSHGGAYRRKSSFIEYSKGLIDRINAWHSRQKNLIPDKYTKTIYGLHFYDSVLVIDKKDVKKPYSERKGHPSTSEDIQWNRKRSFRTLLTDYIDSFMARLKLPSIYRNR